MNKGLSVDDLGIDLFKENTVSLVISLLNPIGIVKLSSKSIKDLFGFTNLELQDKNVKLIIPNYISVAHD